MDLSPEGHTAIEQLEESLRQLGIYDAHTTMIEDDDRRFLVLDATLGDHAFSDRVQDPERAATDRTVREMGIDLHRTDFDEARERIRRNLAAGRHPFEGEHDR